jgi:uncharacterized membrane protein YqiK
MCLFGGNLVKALAILPLFLIIIIYFIVLGFTIWFAVSLIKAQKERNVVLKEISSKLDVLEINKKGE